MVEFKSQENLFKHRNKNTNNASKSKSS